MDRHVSQSSGTPLVRRLLRALGGAWAGGVFANLLFAIVDGTRATRLTVVLVLLLLGSVVGLIESRDAGPWRVGDVRQGAIGWGVFVAIVIGTIAAIVLPMPWAVGPGIAATVLTLAFAFDVREQTVAPRHPDQVALDDGSWHSATGYVGLDDGERRVLRSAVLAGRGVSVSGSEAEAAQLGTLALDRALLALDK